ncbi:invasion associated locus B family protein [Xanthobacter sp. V0B-10]|uniref:invasion associated locus B family protein n=1 Tax=Xanthobacter albus TaxID=3119929 RepID=UPI00372BF07E
MKRSVLALAAAGLALLAAAPVSAQQKPAAAPAAGTAPAPSQPAATTATYQDWMLRCVAQDESARTCEIVQNLQVQGQGVVASIAVGRADPKAPVSVVVQLPPGVWLPAGVKLQVDEKAKPIALEFKRCLQSCFAEATLDAATLQQMRAAGGPGSFTFENGARRATTLPVSFKGFAPALDAGVKS